MSGVPPAYGAQSDPTILHITQRFPFTSEQELARQVKAIRQQRNWRRQWHNPKRGDMVWMVGPRKVHTGTVKGTGHMIPHKCNINCPLGCTMTQQWVLLLHLQGDSVYITVDDDDRVFTDATQAHMYAILLGMH